MSFYNKTIESTFKELKSGKDGLNSEEAKSLLKTYGKNQLKAAYKLSIINLLGKQILLPFNYSRINMRLKPNI